MWATALPCDLLLDIFLRLGSTTIIRCAGVCRPWRRAIIGNSYCLRPRPDCSLPDLLLAFFDAGGRLRQHRTLGRLESVLALDSVVDVSLYDTPLTSRDAFLLLCARGIKGKMVSNNLCLCNLLTGSCRFVAAAALDAPSVQCTYALATTYDYNDDDEPKGAGGSSVRIVAVAGEENCITYQIFSSTSGVWGPVKRSAKLSEVHTKVHVLDEPKHGVVCSGAVVYRLVTVYAAERYPHKYSLFAMDVRTERTWTTELPKQWEDAFAALVLATSEDGRRLSLIAAQSSQRARHKIEVWVLTDDGDSRWTQQRTMDMQSYCLPNWPHIWLRGFCPRSGCLLFTIATKHRDRRQQSSSASTGARPG